MGSKIHPTAIVDPSAVLGDDVEIGPHCLVEADTALGDGCRLLSNVVIRRHTRMGADNVVHPFAVLGGEPQDVKFKPETVSWLEIGSGNTFRESVTIHRATGEGNKTVVGDNNYWMAYSHAGHNCQIGSNCVFVNGAAMAGHVAVGDRVILSAHVGVHQYCWIGDMVMTQGNSGITMHFPPYCINAEMSVVVGLNSIGLRRSPDLTDADRRQIKEAFRLTYRSGLSVSHALAAMDEHAEWGPAADKFRQFVRRVLEANPPHRRGLSPGRPHIRQAGRNWDQGRD